MPRVARYAPGGLVYHALNRAVARLPLFRKEADYEAFERVVEEAHARVPLDVLSEKGGQARFLERQLIHGDLSWSMGCSEC